MKKNIDNEESQTTEHIKQQKQKEDAHADAQDKQQQRHVDQEQKKTEQQQADKEKLDKKHAQEEKKEKEVAPGSGKDAKQRQADLKHQHEAETNKYQQKHHDANAKAADKQDALTSAAGALFPSAPALIAAACVAVALVL